MKQLQDDGVLEYAPDEDGIFREAAAQGVLSYLLKDVRYRPDNPYYSMIDAVEFGLPKKPRYQLQDGDYAINEYPETKGYFFDSKAGKWVAFDNSTNDCFVEEFDKESEAIKWVKGEFEIE
ncbi:hypothetical protein [Bacteroides thetaiotaomicron]|uniref:hypothetical protein n=1 Tax=Bacteroides thetaiotaomicron TaxID=818 RepID=UPI001F3CF5BD|nr:hypothetical protein [Bacteroides thetaiotaomicron]